MVSESPRVLMVAPQPFFENRGMPISVSLRCEALAQLGCSIDLVTYPMGEERKPAGTRVHRSPSLPGISRVPAGPSIRKLLLDIVLFVYLVLHLSRKTGSYDWIHCHEEAALLAVPAARLFGLPLVYDHHSHLGEITEHSGYGHDFTTSAMSQLESMALRLSNAVICVIPALEDSIRSRTNHDRVFVIPDTAPEELDAGNQDVTLPTPVTEWIDEDRITLVYTGSLAGYQTMGNVLRALSRVEENSNYQLLLVGGTSSELTWIQSVIEKQGLSNTVRLTGRVPGDQVPVYLKVADVLLSPRARTRNTPLKVFSYMWAGKPILASDVEAHRVIFDERDVVWADPTVAGYERALLSLLNCDLGDLRSAIEGKYAREYDFEQFTIRHRRFLEAMNRGVLNR